MHRLNLLSPIDPAFIHIAPSIHFRKAKVVAADADSESTVNLQDPDLILLFTWTGAKPHHIAKYASGYTKLFPSSSIMVITSSLHDLLHRSSGKRQRTLISAVLPILSSRLDSHSLVHCFSESGAHSAIQFAKAFLKITGRRLPMSALCLDTGRGTLSDAKKPPVARWNTAHRTALSSTLTSLLAYTLAPSCWTTYPVVCDAFTNDSKHLFACDKSRRALNDPRLWNVRAPRCYLFANADKLTDPRSVLEHARSAVKLGARVFVTLFDGPACADSIEAAVYWATILRTWDAGTADEPVQHQDIICTSDDVEKRATDIGINIHVSVDELLSCHSPIDRRPTEKLPICLLSASSSVYSSDSRNVTAVAAATADDPPAAAASLHSYSDPPNRCTKKHKSRWYDCLGLVPAYQGWGGMAVDAYSGMYL